jgi:predicted unusual protein kinase regulating ubiquinone biosynthesis (AarF/ABC1/UbiB family)
MPNGSVKSSACSRNTAWPTGSRVGTTLGSRIGFKVLTVSISLTSKSNSVRLTLTELGTTFIKLGQVLSTRPDVVGVEMASELAHLQTAAPADPPETVRATIEGEFGKALKDLFTQFEETPLASGSIAQVHLARLLSGEQIVVKVQHAGIADKIMPDLDILAGLAELAQKQAPQIRLYQPAAVVRQFRHTLLRELDFTSELRNLEEFAKHFAQDETVHFPRAFPQFSARRVLAMERMDGILGTDSLTLAASGADLEEFARRGAHMYLQMIFRDAFYHADPHPGNLMLLPGGVVGVLDCGMTGRLDEDLAEASMKCSWPSSTTTQWTWETLSFALGPCRPARLLMNCAPNSPISLTTTWAREFPRVNPGLSFFGHFGPQIETSK